MTAIHRSALVPYSAQEMFDLVADIPSYPKFLPWCGGARILSKEQDAVIASVDIAYSGGFIDHYITALIYPDGLTRTTQIAIGSGVLIMNVVLYALVIRRQRKGGR